MRGGSIIRDLPQELKDKAMKVAERCWNKVLDNDADSAAKKAATEAYLLGYIQCQKDRSKALETFGK